jgi:hypothetical protein
MTRHTSIVATDEALAGRSRIWPHPFAIAILITSLAPLAYAQESRSPFVHADPEPSPIEATWSQLKAPDATVRVETPGLALELRNLQRYAVAAGLDIRVARNGRTVTRRVALRPFVGYERRAVQLDFTPAELGLATLQFSGAIYVAVAVDDVRGRPLPHAELFPIYYHPDGGTLLFYRRRALVQHFGGGDFRGGIATGGIVTAARLALQDAGLQVEPKLSRVSSAVTTFDTRSDASGRKRYCLVISSDTFYDSSGRVWTSPTGVPRSENYGEDYGINGYPLPMSRAYAILSQGGNQLWVGHLDQFGCTPYVLAASNTSTSISYVPYYSTKHSSLGVNIQMFTTDATIDAAVPVPLFQMVVPPTHSPLVVSWMDEDEYAHSIFAAAAAGLERYPGGHTSVTYEFRLGEEGDNSGTYTDYSPFGWPIIYVKHSTAAKSKFTLGHEYGHAIVMAYLSPPLTPDDIDYSVEAGEANQHTWTSKEWQLVAAFEGWAHFVSGAIWNDVGTDADCKVVVGSNINPHYQAIVDLNRFDRVFENAYGPAYLDQGVEQDWAQFFWNYRTDALSPIGTPTDAQLVNLWAMTYPWPKYSGFFSHLAAAVPVAIPLPAPLIAQPRFVTFGTLAGIAH